MLLVEGLRLQRRLRDTWRLVDISVSHPRSGRAFYRVAAFDFIILASRRLGRGALLACHLISHWRF